MRSISFYALLGLLASAIAWPAYANEPIKVGLNYPATGRYKEEGMEQMRGALLAIEEINQNGGILGRPIELLSINSASDPERAINNVQHLAKEGARMIFGGASSAVAISAGQEAAKLNLLYMATLTYANETTGADGHKHLFRETYNAHMAAKALATYMGEQLKDKKLFYLTADYNWGHSTEQSLRTFTQTEDRNLHPGALTSFPRPRESDMRAALKAAKDSNADVLVVSQFGDDMALALRLAHSMGLKDHMTIIVPSLTQNMARTAGPLVMENVIGTLPWNWKVPHYLNHERGKAFVNTFVERYQAYPCTSAAAAYHNIYQYRDAVERAKTFNTQAVIKALEGHRYQLLKDEQYWRALDHQSVQSVFVVRTRARQDILKSHLHDDYFDIVMRLDGDRAVQTPEEWQQERQAANKPLSL